MTRRKEKKGSVEGRDAASDTSQSIIDSTLSVLAEDGISNLTTKSVSKRADVSTGAIHYFFDTRDNLIYSAFVFVVRSIRDEILTLRQQEPDPLQRMKRTIDIQFAPNQLSADAASIWPQFWVCAGYDEQTSRLFKVYSARMISNFTVDLVACGMERAPARLKAIEICALIQGLWIEVHLGQSIDSADSHKVFERIWIEVAEAGGFEKPRKGKERASRRKQ